MKTNTRKQPAPRKGRHYFLTGVYPPEMGDRPAYQRWAERIQARSPAAAERKALSLYPGLGIAGVLEDPSQTFRCVDTEGFSPVP